MAKSPSFTKLAGASSGALLLLVLINIGGRALYERPVLDVPSYPPVDESEASAEPADEPVEEPSFEELLAQADPQAGERVFKECRACHKTEPGVHSVGPSLYGVVGRAVASFDDFRYSGALDGTGDAWTPAAIDAFITNPRAYAPGTAMSYNGLRDARDRANVIAYLESIGG
ncbi:cytochrome c [Rhodovulum bhavnagarense]|uniref:Cytochrome c n=1 Tax=Rhodovulum bhavnagarense TaxID=992286 RepID=A0A4R2RNH1_9RHOB|nr:c-type cytochrome [Rhodovulum bhavnagarense]TCP60745.1 cytochrome c [Rhodovulum bhavnagarense]